MLISILLINNNGKFDHNPAPENYLEIYLRIEYCGAVCKDSRNSKIFVLNFFFKKLITYCTSLALT